MRDTDCPLGPVLTRAKPEARRNELNDLYLQVPRTALRVPRLGPQGTYNRSSGYRIRLNKVLPTGSFKCGHLPEGSSVT